MIEVCEATEDNPFIHGMSRQFVRALQQLFDIMDTNSSGTIKYCDIAIQWEEDQSDPFFPKGLVSCLAKVTLPNGLLTFDRFCAGIKLCLLKNQVEINGDLFQDDFINNLNDNATNPTNDNSFEALNSFGNFINRNFDSNSKAAILVEQAQQTLSSLMNAKEELQLPDVSKKLQTSSNNVSRPPSEPSILAPAPPEVNSSLQNPEIRSSNDLLNSSSISSASLSNPTQNESPCTPSTSTGTNTASESEDSVNSPIKKKHQKLSKRPLPTYEQVMAAKNSLKPTGLLNKITGVCEKEQNSLENNNEQKKNTSDTLATVLSVKEDSEITVDSLLLALPSKNYHNHTGNNGVSKLFVKPTNALPGGNKFQSHSGMNDQSSTSSASQNYSQNLYENFDTSTSLTRSQVGTASTQQQTSAESYQHQKQSITMVELIHGQRAKSMTHLDAISNSNIAPPLTSSSEIKTQEFSSHFLPDFSAPLSQRSQSMNQSSKSTHNLGSDGNNSQKFLSHNQLGMMPNENGNSNPGKTSSGTSLPKTLSRSYIMKTLQNWRDNILQHNSSTNSKQNDDSVKNIQQQSSQVMSQKQPEVKLNSPRVITEINTNGLPVPPPKPPLNLSRALLSDNSGTFLKKRREPRRHTVGANGIDIYAVKRYQLLEQEKEILFRGLSGVEKTKEWFIRQISGIQDKINLVGRGQAVGVVGSHIVGGGGGNDCNIDAYQERINFQAARIANLNQHMNSMRESGQNFPLHMNLAFRPFNPIIKIDPNSPKQLVVNPNLVNKLKDQNRLLTEEVGRKGQRITQLEREKAALIRELFQARTYGTYYSNGTDFDDTLM